MSEVEKMYENAGFIQKRCKDYSCIVCDKNKDCEKPPPFTAEKQIKIIEWLDNSKAFFGANETISSLITNHKGKNGIVKCYKGKGNSVDSCLASLINNLWQDLTEEERKQIRGILE